MREGGAGRGEVGGGKVGVKRRRGRECVTSTLLEYNAHETCPHYTPFPSFSSLSYLSIFLCLLYAGTFFFFLISYPTFFMSYVFIISYFLFSSPLLPSFFPSSPLLVLFIQHFFPHFYTSYFSVY